MLRKHLLVAAAAGAATMATASILLRSNKDGPITKIDHTPIHRGGTGSPLVLLHGVTATWRVWAPTLPYLEPHHHVLAPTLLGHAGAKAFDTSKPLSVEAIADEVEDTLDKAGVAEAHIVGNSLGGWVAVELARRRRANSLVLFSPAGASATQEDISRVTNTFKRILGPLTWCGNHADAITSRKALQALMLFTQVAHPSRISPAEFAASLRAVAQSRDISNLLDALSLAQMRELELGQHFPIRLVWPQRDLVLPFNRFGLPTLQRIPDAQLTRLPGVGHVPMSDAPAKVAELILGVTTEVDAAASQSTRKTQNR